MTKYTLTLKLKDTNESYEYSVNLDDFQQDYPQTFFNNIKEREAMRKELQQKSKRLINNDTLSSIINKWIKEISLGFRAGFITFNDLPYPSGNNIESLNELGNQELPKLIEPVLSGIKPRKGALPPLVFS
jgi:hypothetical protein